MRKILSFLMVLSLLAAVCVPSAASSPDVCFSVEGAEGAPGDTVEVRVYLTENPGIWAARFDVNFDPDDLTLLDVSNGTVFTNGEFIKSRLDLDGFYVYYAQLDIYGANNYNEGVILTLAFRINEGAEDSQVSLSFPNGGAGWFFSGLDPTVDYTVPANGSVSCTVSVTDNTSVPGDLNCDGKLNAVDCNLIKALILGMADRDEARLRAADLNADGKINAVDGNLLKQWVLGL